jgi:hypothetical protein
MEYTWKNIVAFKVWECKLCGKTSDRDGICDHLHKNHGLNYIEIGCDETAYSKNFEYPDLINKELTKNANS